MNEKQKDEISDYEVLQLLSAAEESIQRAIQTLYRRAFVEHFDRVAGKKAQKDLQKDLMSSSVEELRVVIDDSRIRNLLRSLNIRTVGDLAGCSQAELLLAPNFGRASLKRLCQNLEMLGVTLRKD